jgi:archaeoflavoprotein AfpA
MAVEKTKVKKMKVAWGITGGGDKIGEFVGVMKEIRKEYENIVEIQVFLSKAAEIVLKYYGLEDDVRKNFAKITVELNSNAPFLAAWMQMRKYEFLLIAPATSNTVAKIANGIGDTLLTNAAIMSLKAFVPVYIAPTDYREGVVYTKLPNGREMRLRVRKEEVEQVKKLERMENVFVLENSQKIREVFKERFGQAAP